MELEFKIAAIKKQMEKWDNEEMIMSWNRRCDDKDPDSYIFTNDEFFFEENFHDRITEAVRATQFGYYNYGDGFVCFNGYANLDSFNYWNDEKSPIDLDVLVDWLMENGDSDTADIDCDEMIEAFIDCLVADEKKREVATIDKHEIYDLINEYTDYNCFDLLTENWNDLADDIEAYYKEKQEE